jgi:hypothetical protein
MYLQIASGFAVDAGYRYPKVILPEPYVVVKAFYKKGHIDLN